MIGALAVIVASLVPRCYPPPVPAPVAVPYTAPACAYCPGHRGLEFHVPNGSPVAAVAGGVVTFAGVVVGTRYVVVLQTDGLRATYGMLSQLAVTKGSVVVARQTVGQSDSRVYFGLRNPAGEPVDPTGLIGRLRGRPRLLPIDGTPPRRTSAPTLVCSVSANPTVRPP